MFNFLKKAKKQKLQREQKNDLYAQNAGCPFSPDIPDRNRWGTDLSYRYEDVYSTITGDVSRLRVGSVLYAKDNGRLSDVAQNIVATVDNEKICNMISDYIKRGDTVTVRVLSVDSKLHINIGFYREHEDLEVDEEDD